MARTLHTMTGRLIEWSYQSGHAYENPFRDVHLDVLIEHKGGRSCRVPAFWAGGNEWRVRFTPTEPGGYTIRTTVNTDPASLADREEGDAVATDLDGLEDSLVVAPGNDGSIRAPRLVDGRLIDGDGRPFFWLGDTWWMGLCNRLSWPEGFRLLTADRVTKGFTVIQIVAGLYPDMPPGDSRAANEAGLPWDESFTTINPGYWDMADLRIEWLVRSGLVPCILGAWGYYLPMIGMETMKAHWRHIIARWGAYPVVFCLAGEATMPWYLSRTKKQDAEEQRRGWTEIAAYVRETDAYDRLLTVHPTRVGRDQVDDDSLIDLNMLQTGHGGTRIHNLYEIVREEVERKPAMPVVVSEVNYEGILHDSGPERQRMQFWASVLKGAAGYTYGANGLWQAQTAEHPHGASPHGATWGNTPWIEAYRYPGSEQVGLAKKLLSHYDWQRIEPHPEWLYPTADPDDTAVPVVAGIPGSLRFVYCYEPITPWGTVRYEITSFEHDARYVGFFWDPRTGSRHDIGHIEVRDDRWEIPMPPSMSDWLLVLESE